MFKKDMTPLAPHSKKGTLQSSPNKGSSQRSLPASATGGASLVWPPWRDAISMPEVRLMPIAFWFIAPALARSSALPISCRVSSCSRSLRAVMLAPRPLASLL